jgi:hypothetical protein
MTAKQSLKYQLRAAQCGFAFEALYTIFWGYFGHNLPPDILGNSFGMGIPCSGF